MAIIEPGHLDLIVAMGRRSAGNQVQWKGTGFSWTGWRAPFPCHIVTCAHVLDDVPLPELVMRINPAEGGPAEELTLMPMVSGKPEDAVTIDEMRDVAVLDVGGCEGGLTLLDDEQLVPLERVEEGGIAEGHEIYVLGFPCGLVGEDRNTPVVRQGVVGHIQDAFRGRRDDFLASVTVFPGDSGAPVFARVRSQNECRSEPFLGVIGIVKEYVPYQEWAIGEQSGHGRVRFIENSGLCRVIPSDQVIAVVEAHLKKRRGRSSH